MSVGIDRKMGDPLDLDELEMQRRYTYKHQMSIEMEQAIDLGCIKTITRYAVDLLKTCLMTASVLSKKTLTTTGRYLSVVLILLR